MKSNNKRVISDFKKRNQVPRKKSKDARPEEESAVCSANEICDGDENNMISNANNDPQVENTTVETSTISSQSTSTTQSVTASISRGNVFLFRNSFLSTLNLELVNVDGIGDCCPLACLTSYLNLTQSLSNKQQRSLSTLKWSMCNMISQGKTLLRGEKYNLWRGKK